MLPVIIIGVIGWASFGGAPVFGATVLVIAVGLGLVVLATQSAVDGLFRLVLFEYAESEAVPAPFEREDLDNALAPRRRRLRRSS